jgi:hypothetical protein
MNLIFDGWSSGSTHYFSVFSSYNMKNGDTRMVMLAFAPLLDETKLDADEIKSFLESTLDIYGKDFSSVVAITADNTAVNPCVANLIGCNFIGCAAHKLNLAVSNLLDQHETLLSKVNTLMVRLGNLKAGAALREKTLLKPRLRCKTRWTGAYEMLKRYERIRPYLIPYHMFWVDVLLSPEDDLHIDSLLLTLKKINEAFLQLQDHKLDLADSRFILDDVINNHDNLHSA